MKEERMNSSGSGRPYIADGDFYRKRNNSIRTRQLDERVVVYQQKAKRKRERDTTATVKHFLRLCKGRKNISPLPSH